MNGESTLRVAPLAVALALLLPAAAFAQEHVHPVAPAQDAAPTPEAEPDVEDPHARHRLPAHAETPVDHSAHAAPVDHSRHAAPVDHSAHVAPAAPEAPRTPIPALTDADRAAAFPGPTAHMEHAGEINSFLRFDRLEAWDDDGATGQAWEIGGWVGTDTDRLWLRSEGERIGGETHSADLELLYGHSITPWWDVVGGLRQDFGSDAQTWAAIGVQGLAPRGFVELQATAYVGDGGQVAAEFEAEHQLRLTARWIVESTLEVALHARDDAERGIGAGLSTAEAGLRLRYEITPRFAPYLGIVHERSFGDTARFRRDDGESAGETRIVAGLRFWF